MASESALGYSAPIMAAQPVDSDTTAAPALSRDIMSSGPAGSANNEETKHMEITEEEMDDSLVLSPLPVKQEAHSSLGPPNPSSRNSSTDQACRNAQVNNESSSQHSDSQPHKSRASRPRLAKTLASVLLRKVGTGNRSPSPGLKRERPSSMGHPPTVPMYTVARGRVAISEQDLWGTAGRMVHRKVAHEGTDTADGSSSTQFVAEQFQADRSAMEQMYSAI
jgi:hypothetical protein